MRKILTILLLAFSLSAWGTKYYVSETGNDGTGDGSSGNPWALVSYACTQASSGDTVYVMAGTINQGTTQIVKPVGVSIYGAGPASHIVSSYTNGSALQAAIQCASTAGTSVDDNSSISYIKLTGSSLTGTRGIHVGYRNNIQIHHVTIEDFLYTGIFVYSSITSYPTLFLTGIKIQNCTIRNCAQYGTGYNGQIRLQGTDGCDVSDCVLDARGRDAGLNAHCLSTLDNKRLKIHDNVLYKNDSEITSGGTYVWNFFMEEWNYKGGSEYYNNTHYGLAKVSLGGEFNEVQSGCTFGYKIRDNSFYNDANGARNVNGNEEDYYCIAIEGDNHDRVEVCRNYIQRYNVGIAVTTPSAGAGYWMTHTWYWDSITIHHNIIENVGYSDFQYGGFGVWWVNETPTDFGLQGEYNNVTIANNTITGNNGGAYHGYAGIGIYANGEVNNLLIANNIITGFSLRGITINEHADDSLTINGLNVIHNDMYDNTSNDIYIESAAGRITITDSDVATGNITTDPLFKSSTDFHLQSTSPCRDAGIDVSAITGGKDFHGASLYGAAYDIGAFEYGVGRLMRINDTILPTINYKVVLIDH